MVICEEMAAQVRIRKVTGENHGKSGKGYLEEEIGAKVRKCENHKKIVNCVKQAWWGTDPVNVIETVCRGANVQHFYSPDLRRNNYRSY
jgi:hypothetical protein